LQKSPITSQPADDKKKAADEEKKRKEDGLSKDKEAETKKVEAY